MNNSSIELEWAWTRVEAMADGALEGADLDRMQRAIDRDPALRKAVGEAEAVIGSLRRARLPAPPAGLLFRLLRAGGRPRRPARGSAVGAPLLGVLSTAAITIAFGVLSVHAPDPAREAALRDFAIAMNYLRQTAVLAQDQVGQQVGLGLAVAVEVSTHSLADEEAGSNNGG